MKKLFNIFFLTSLTALLFTACKKDESKAIFNGNTAVTLATTATTLNLAAEDSLQEAIKFSWSDPNYQINGNRSTLRVTYTLEIDTTGGNFQKPITASVVDAFEVKYLVKEINNLLIKYGLKPGETRTLNARLTSSLYWEPSKATSNTVTLTVTPYQVKPTPKFPVPDNLYIVGSATAGEWSNPVPVPTQRLTKIDEFTFGIIIPLEGGQHYLLLPNNGSWDHKYAIADKEDPAFQTGGDLIVDGGEDIPAPLTSGVYKIIVNFVTGAYSVTPVANDDTPANLFIVGDATPGEWANPVPLPNQQFEKTSNNGFTITLPLVAGKHYLFLPNNGSWDHKYAVADKEDPEAKLGGPFLTDTGEDIPAPDEAGTYKIEVEFVTRTYRVTKQ